jgi:hypothetical protein
VYEVIFESRVRFEIVEGSKWGLESSSQVTCKCNKWTGCRTCAANVFSKAELGRGEVVAVTVKYWHQIACVDMEGGVKWRCEWQKLGWELKGKLDSTGLTFVWLSQQKCNLGDMIKLGEENYSGLERQCGGSSLVPSLDINFSCGKNGV